MPTVTRDDLVLYYAERGDPAGPPVVLLHGLTMSSVTMERLAASLDDHRVLLLDLHGHGKSTKPHQPTALVLQMPVFARGVPVGRVFFAALAALFTGLYPVLTPLHPVIRRLPVPDGAHELAFIRDLLATDHLAQAALMRGISRQEAPAKDADTLSPLTMPVLVAAHAYDPLHSFDDAMELTSGLADARQLDLRSILDYGLRHGEINRVVGAFLRGLPPATIP
jgi:hypothetical protein